ncbi:MAG: hypothetical protein K8L99_28285 [Anaerolineae bacterium]|nr:hypothetical protein [Anaerolineae bacterium]
MLDDLRRSTYEDDDFDPLESEDEFVFGEDDEEVSQRLFLGMTAVERMFLSIFFFMNIVVLGLAFLVATGRIVF